MDFVKVITIARVRAYFLEAHWDLLVVKCLAPMKALNWDILMVKCLTLFLEMYMESHLGLMLEHS